MDSNFKMAKATKTTPEKPHGSGSEIQVTSEQSSSQIFCGHSKGISLEFGYWEPDVLFRSANANC